MKADNIFLEQKYKPKTILFKVIPYKSYKSPIHQNTQMNFNSTFDFNNNEMIPDTYEDYIIIIQLIMIIMMKKFIVQN